MLNLRTPASLVALASVALAATPVQVGFPAPPTGIVVQSNFLGISLELSYLNIYCAFSLARCLVKPSPYSFVFLPGGVQSGMTHPRHPGQWSTT